MNSLLFQTNKGTGISIIDAKSNKKFVAIYEKYDAKLSFTDCSIITSMLSENIDNLISFDDEFKKLYWIFRRIINVRRIKHKSPL